MSENNVDKDMVGVIPVYKDIFPQEDIDEDIFIKEILNGLHLRDCVFILSRLSRQYYAYCRQSDDGSEGRKKYNDICLDFCNEDVVMGLNNHVIKSGKPYDIIFPDLSIMHLQKLCLKYCDRKNFTPINQDFSQDTVHKLGLCLLATNSLLHKSLIDGYGRGDDGLAFICNCTKQIIADHNFWIYQRMYRVYFLFNKFFKKYLSQFNLENVFKDKYGLSIEEYFSFLFLVFSKYAPNDKDGEGPDDMPGLDFRVALKNLKKRYKDKIINNFILDEDKYTDIDTSFYNIIPLTLNSLIKLQDETVIPINLRCLFLGITEALYFDILDYLSEKDQKIFSTYFGYAIEDYFQDIIKNVDEDVILPKKYGKDQETPDAILLADGSLVFFECKKRQFHTLEFLRAGTKETYLERINEFFFKPLEQLCKRIKDFREGKFVIDGVDNKNVKIYPVIISPSAPPIFSGGWDIQELDKYVKPPYYKEDSKLAPPEFIDFDELESIEVYLKKNPDKSFIDLINIKRSDKSYHNANWVVILQKNNILYKNNRLLAEYIDSSKRFHDLLFKKGDD